MEASRWASTVQGPASARRCWAPHFAGSGCPGCPCVGSAPAPAPSRAPNQTTALDRALILGGHRIGSGRTQPARASPRRARRRSEGHLRCRGARPGWCTTQVVHPYTEGGPQIAVWHDGDWLELAECGRIQSDVLRGSGLDPEQWSGLALGMGLERALILRTGIPDIRYLRSAEPSIAAQMQDLEPWRPISMLPSVCRDISIVIDEDTDDETLGDTIRTALGSRCSDIESTEVLARTRHDDLPHRVRERLGTRPGQVNALV